MNHNIVVIGASAGGVEALTQLVKRLPSDLPMTLFVAIHFPAHSISLLPKILSRSGPLPASHAKDGKPIRSRQIYIAPPNYHLLVRQGYLKLSRGPRENGHRPAIDALFRSAARSYGHQTVGIVLSGALDDGTVGLRTIKACHGVTIAQDPDEALFNSMPRSAIDHVGVDYVLKIPEIAALLVKLAPNSVQKGTTMQEGKVTHHEMPESEIVAQNKAELERGEHPGNASTFTCPDCGGVLWELRNDNLIRFRCHVGHAYSLDSLMAEQTDDLERALWSAIRALEEKAALARRMSIQLSSENRHRSAAQFQERAEEAAQSADLLRRVAAQQQNQTQADPVSENNSQAV